MQNYALYGSYYAVLLSSLKANYPNRKSSKTGLLIQAQYRYPHKTHIHMRGEQTIHMDPKISG